MSRSNSILPDLEERDATNLISLHIAEYQTLTTRGTYWITLHVALISLVPVILTAVVFIWTNSSIDRRLLFWGLYIEKVLRPAVNELITPSRFWWYEPFLIKLRSSSSNPQFIPALWEFPIAIIATVLVPIILFHSYEHENSMILAGLLGWCGLILYLLFLAFIWEKSITVRKIRAEFSDKATASIETADARKK